jgi:hypothetical protein
MASPSIADKLAGECEKELLCESQVVYILVEIGKLLEHDNAKRKYPTIVFYRDWVVHTRLERSPWVKNLMSKFDDYIVSANRSVTQPFQTLLKSLTLRSELSAYMATHSLHAPFCSDDRKWKAFVKLLAGVICDVPLAVDVKQRKPSTKYVQSVTVERSRNQSGVATLTWTATCHSPLPDGVFDWIDVVLFPGDDIVITP